MRRKPNLKFSLARNRSTSRRQRWAKPRKYLESDQGGTGQKPRIRARQGASGREPTHRKHKATATLLEIRAEEDETSAETALFGEERACVARGYDVE